MISMIVIKNFRLCYTVTVKGINSFIGIYKDENCSQTVDTHALQLIGYGDTENGEPYWIARNSWGLSIHYTLDK
jgi:C1A family cysteine protease